MLEIGVGTGVVALGLGALGREVIGLDRSPAMPERAHARLEGRVLLAPAAAVPLATERLDNVYAVWVLQPCRARSWSSPRCDGSSVQAGAAWSVPPTAPL